MRCLTQLSSLVLVVLMASTSFAAGDPVKAPNLGGYALKARKAVYKKIFKRLRAGERLSQREITTAADDLANQRLESAAFRKAISITPLEVRFEIFKRYAAHPDQIQTAERHVEGYMPHLKTMMESTKTFLTLTNDNLHAFKAIMGPNVLMFAGKNTVDHLYTWVADQVPGPETMFSNTYGYKNEHTVEHGSAFKLALPVLLTDAQMARFVDYMNTGVEHGKDNAYGFYAGPDQKILKGNKIECTNWVTAAPIGSLKGWVKALDKGIKRLAVGEAFGAHTAKLRQEGLHGLLASVSHAERGLGMDDDAATLARTDAQNKRQTIMRAVLDNPVLEGSLWDRAEKLGSLFDKERGDFYKRNPETVGRESLADMLDIKRSRNPDKFMADLMLSPLTPLAILHHMPTGSPLARTPFNLRFSGTLKHQEGTRSTMVQNREEHWQNHAHGVNVPFNRDGTPKEGIVVE